MARVPELFSLQHRVAIVTGGSRGLGLEIARGLGEAGARIVIVARRTQWLDEASAELAAAGIEVRAHACDVTVPGEAERLVGAAATAFGGVDILVNNAGVSWGAPFEEMPLDRWRQVFETNVVGVFLVTRAALPAMKSRGYGKVINIASVMGLVGFAPEIVNASGYSASKGALIALTRDLAVKYGRFGIRVNALAPSFFLTRMTEGLLARGGVEIVEATPLGRLGHPDDIKGAAVFLASPASDYITGQVLSVDGGLTAT
ncbi:MAG TPA: SDR family oxidoreductase [bacterium]|nr:SDR family oxidoreductase [bacterium]